MPQSFITLNCKNCNRKFDKLLHLFKRSKNHFCSRSCAAKFNNKGVAHNPPRERICKNCNSIFFTSKTRNLKYHRSIYICPDCKAKEISFFDFIKGKTLGEYHELPSVKGKHFSWINSHIRALNRSWNKALTKKPCHNCEYSRHVELCHIKAISTFPKTATVGEINHKLNVVQLCRNCHWEFDHGLISL